MKDLLFYSSQKQHKFIPSIIYFAMEDFAYTGLLQQRESWIHKVSEMFVGCPAQGNLFFLCSLTFVKGYSVPFDFSIAHLKILRPFLAIHLLFGICGWQK